MLDRLRQSLRSSWCRLVGNRKVSESSTDTNSGSAGRKGERLAAKYLQQNGYRILFRSYRSWLGEIDLIALHEKQGGVRSIVFVEVKTWSKPREGSPGDAVDPEKQRRLTKLALEFLKSRKLLEHRARFDVVEVILMPRSIRHFENAFEATGNYQLFS